MSVAASVRLEVQPHPRGLWLVRAGHCALAVPPTVGRALLPLDGVTLGCRRVQAGVPVDLEDGVAPEADAIAAMVIDWLLVSTDGVPVRGRGGPPRGSLPLRVPLLPTRLVRRLAAALTPLAAWPALGVLASAGLASSYLARPWAAPGVLTPWAFALFGLGALWHELGHAAALRREGYQPGGIGAGVLLVVPVLFADVSAVGLLPREGRLRVDLAGLAFQAGAAGLFAMLGLAAFLPTAVTAALRTASVASLLALGYGLLPLPRTDGSWALRDALGADGPPDCPAARATRALTVLQFALGGLACLMLPARLVGLAGRAFADLGLPLPFGVRRGAAWLLLALALGWWLQRAWSTLRAVRPGRAAA